MSTPTKFYVLACLFGLSAVHTACLDFQTANQSECDDQNQGDGIDNDGDGIVDEGCSCVYAESTQGVCGTATYDEYGTSKMCGAPLNYYAVEVAQCDGFDNDCDGLVDEGCRCGFSENEVGVCALGRVTDAGTCTQPDLYETDELACDGYDNDCDGITDEGCPQCDFQGKVVGVCAHGRPEQSGMCAPPLNWSDDEQDCRVDVLGGDGVDNDCDGQVDEGCACPFQDSRVGVCASGQLSEQGCDAPARHEPVESSCDGLDNDCDGQADEGCAPEDIIIPDDDMGMEPAECNGTLSCQNGTCVCCESGFSRCINGVCTCDDTLPTPPVNAPSFDSTPPSQANENTTLNYDVVCANDGDAETSLAIGMLDTCGGVLQGDAYRVDLDETTGGTSCTLHLECMANDMAASQTQTITILEDDVAPEFVAPLPFPLSLPKRQDSEVELTVFDHDLPAQTLGITIKEIDCTQAQSFTIVDNMFMFACGDISEECTFMLEVSDGELSSTVDGTLSCTNSPPEVSDVTIVPAGTGQELECTYTYTDVESDPDQSITTWYVNGVMESMGSTLPTHGPGDSIRCEVTPFDGEEMGTTQEATFDATPAPPLEMLTSGASHTCTIIAGRAMCWGGNSAGQVGVGHNNLTSPPATPQGLSSGVTAISAGNQHTCAIQNGGLFCWGANNRGQLGTGDRTDASTPQPVMNMSSGVTAVAAGNLHTCAIKNDELYCWGTNGFGELGQGVAGDSMNLPRLVSPGIFTQPVERISAGAHHNCAVQGPQLYCWGSNDGGQIGIDPVTTFSGTPQAIAMFGNGISLLDTGSHFTCASSTGSLYCWGLNDHGQLGDGSLISTFTPTQVSGLSADVTALTTGAGSACAVHQNRLKCWGQNRTGQLGNGTMIGSPLPAGVTGLPMGPDAITISSEHACASIQDTLYCWGENGQSQLGDTMPSSTSPRQISIQ